MQRLQHMLRFFVALVLVACVASQITSCDVTTIDITNPAQVAQFNALGCTSVKTLRVSWAAAFMLGFLDHATLHVDGRLPCVLTDFGGR
jgi:hypothetical protein